MKRDLKSSALSLAAAMALTLAVMGGASAQQAPRDTASTTGTAKRDAHYTPLSFDETSMDRLGNSFFEDMAASDAKDGKSSLRLTLPYRLKPAEEPQRPEPSPRGLPETQDPGNR